MVDEIFNILFKMMFCIFCLCALFSKKQENVMAFLTLSILALGSYIMMR